MDRSPHYPVMLAEVLDALSPRDGGTYVDATFGAGGYTRAMLEAADCTVFAIDRDETAVARGRALAENFAGRLHVLHGRFGDMQALLAEAGIYHVDGVAMDLGVSSMQLDQAERGFSFSADGPLDMRMGSADRTAADVVNEAEEGELADLIYAYGEERASRRIARAICRARAEAPITRTGELADIIRRAIKTPKQKGGIDPATRTFQALRIHVNDELGELDRGLLAAEHLLVPNGRLAVVSFHSLEDRRVKTFLRERAGDLPHGSRHLPEAKAANAPTFALVRRGAVKPTDAEISENARSRSARLRVAERTDAPAWAA